MPSRVRRVATAATVLAVAVLVVAVFGVATSAAWPHATSHSTTSQRVERFLALSNDASSNSAQVILAKGPIHARGTDTAINDNNDVFAFPGGSLRIYHKATRQHDSYDPVTCFGRHTEKGTYRITGATGKYAGASGHGHYRLRIFFVGCSQTAPPDVFQLVIKASGPIRL
jgi:hypothetical protein